MKLNFITICITLLWICSCTKKELPVDASPVEIAHSVPVSTTTVVIVPSVSNVKVLTSNLKFLGSLEKEVLKLLMQSEAPEVNQFEVLAYGFDKFNGAKNGFLPGFGCQKIAVRSVRDSYEVYSECTRPAKKLAELTESLKNHWKVIFLTANWKVILGNAAGLNADRVCDILLMENKVQSLDCKDTVLSPRNTGLDISFFELKIKKYIFNRNQPDELKIEGGQYKDMIEIKKISLTAPMTGKISIIEKELKVKDDFADLQNKLLGVEEEKKDEEPKNEEKKETTPHTAEPEYINEAEAQAPIETQTTPEASATEEIPTQPYGR